MFVFISPTHQLGCVASHAPINSCYGGSPAGDPILKVGEAKLRRAPLNLPPITFSSDSEDSRKISHYYQFPKTLLPFPQTFSPNTLPPNSKPNQDLRPNTHDVLSV